MLSYKYVVLGTCMHAVQFALGHNYSMRQKPHTGGESAGVSSAALVIRHCALLHIQHTYLYTAVDTPRASPLDSLLTNMKKA